MEIPRINICGKFSEHRSARWSSYLLAPLGAALLILAGVSLLEDDRSGNSRTHTPSIPYDSFRRLPGSEIEIKAYATAVADSNRIRVQMHGPNAMQVATPTIR